VSGVSQQSPCLFSDEPVRVGDETQEVNTGLSDDFAEWPALPLPK